MALQISRLQIWTELFNKYVYVQLSGKKKKAQNNISSFASTTLAKAAFLCSVLLEDSECHHLAFKVGMFGLEMPRPPASSKALEVKEIFILNFES